MTYEVKSIQPGTVFLNAMRIFLVVGFIVAVLSFYILPNPAVRVSAWWQRLLATALFTVVYTIVVSFVLTAIAWLYNLWAVSGRGIRVHLEEQE